MADELIGREIKVLDKGFVRVVDLMGDDSSIVQAARVSYGKGTKTVSDDRSLIRYLMAHGHTTPFEMCEIKLHIKIPMDAWRQMVRHRTASINEVSTRYSEVPEEFQCTDANAWRSQSKTARQGSGHTIPKEMGESLSLGESVFLANVYNLYKRRLAFGVAREQARKDLPLSTYTQAYWKIDLHNLFHFLSKRLPEDAQYEIRQYANAIADIVKQWVPMAWGAFENYRLNAITLSGEEVRLIQMMNKSGEGAHEARYQGSVREAKESRAKLSKLGFTCDIRERK